VANVPKVEVTSQPKLLFKFCSAECAAAILEHNQIFITSPLDLNDPFEMRPGWTDEHASRQNLNEQMRTALTTGMPVFSARTEGPVHIGQMPQLEVQPPMNVESQRGIADGLNEQVFEILHQHFRVLSLVSELFLSSEPGDVLPADGESGEEATLMWSHYADQFQGVCLALDPSAFDNGTQPGGITVEYPPERRGLPASFYDSYLSIGRSPSADEEAKLRQSFIDFLTTKSPAWKYEKEVRMIYDLPRHLKSANCRRVELACSQCQARGEPANKCKQALYRDAVHLPADAIRAIIFGADCPSAAVDQILKVRSGASFKNVRIYWSSLHSARYAVHYIEADEEYIRFFYEHRDTIMAGAKKHYTRASKGLTYIPAKKGEMYDMDRRSARPRDDKSETA
jgi:Protein of unknown function (DUF2971)